MHSVHPPKEHIIQYIISCEKSGVLVVIGKEGIKIGWSYEIKSGLLRSHLTQGFFLLFFHFIFKLLDSLLLSSNTPFWLHFLYAFHVPRLHPFLPSFFWYSVLDLSPTPPPNRKQKKKANFSATMYIQWTEVREQNLL